MELTGLQIFKYLPAAKKLAEANCKKCGYPTCMAYALKLAKKQADIDSCPNIPEELKEKFTKASKIQQHEIKISDSIITGGETVMFRHDKTFVNKTVIAVELDCKQEDFDEALEQISSFQIERIGEIFKVDAIYLEANDNDLEYKSAVSKIKEKGLDIISKSCSDYKIVSGHNLENIVSAAQEEINKGFNKLILELETDKKKPDVIIEELTYLRRAAIINRFEPLTYPVLVKVPQNLNALEAAAYASLLICRYANILVLSKEQGTNKALLAALSTLRQSIYTNPQKPLQVEPKVYEFNEPDKNAPILLTTNFALTYFAVAGELEQLPFGSYLVVTPSDGMSVLTAWSADKFTAELVAKSIKNYDLLSKVETRSIIIPGLLSHMKEELQDVLPEWNIVVGTIEACQIPDFLKHTEKQIQVKK